MLDAAFGLNGRVGLLFKKQIEVSHYDLKFKELSRKGCNKKSYLCWGIPKRSKAFLVFLAITFLHLRANAGQIFKKKSLYRVWLHCYHINLFQFLLSFLSIWYLRKYRNTLSTWCNVTVEIYNM